MNFLKNLFTKKQQKQPIQSIIVLNNDATLKKINGTYYVPVQYRIIENFDTEKSEIFEYLEDMIIEKEKKIKTQNEKIDFLNNKIFSYENYTNLLQTDLNNFKTKRQNFDKDIQEIGKVKSEKIKVLQKTINEFENSQKKIIEENFNLKTNSNVVDLNILINKLKQEKHNLQQTIKQKEKQLEQFKHNKKMDNATIELIELESIITKNNLMWSKEELKYIEKEEENRKEIKILSHQIELLKIEISDLKITALKKNN